MPAPAVQPTSVLSSSSAEKLAFELAVGEAGRCVQHHVVDREAGAAAKGAEPGIRKFVRSERIVGAAGLNVRFDTEHKLTHLPVVTDLTSASDAARLSDVVCNLAPLVTEIQTGVWAGPVIGTRGRRIIRRRATRKIRGNSTAARRRRDCHRHDRLLHLTLHSTPLPARPRMCK